MTDCKGLSARFAATIAIGLAAYGEPAAAASNQSKTPFDVAELFFELNDTDGDLGIHALVDGGPWRQLEIEDPNGRRLLNVRVQSQLRRQGLTELFFESAEPPFDELPPEEFFDRFPEGSYAIAGLTLEGGKLESLTDLSHVLPAPPEASVNGEPAAEDCDADVPVIRAPIRISWEQVTLSHPELGRTNEPIEVVRYEVVITREAPTLLELSAVLDPGSRSFRVPGGLLRSGEEIKYEILVREAGGNQTAVESCLEVK